MNSVTGTLLRILALTRKELLAVLKDRRSRMSLLIPPVVQALIFGYAATYDLNHATYAVLDQDRSAASRQLLAGLDGSGVFERVADLQRAGDVKSTLDARRALLIVQIDSQFERHLLSGQRADVQLIADGRNSNTAGTALGYFSDIVDQFNSSWGHDHGVAPPPLQVIARAWYNPNLETRWFMIPGMIGTLTLLQTLMLTAMSIAREREQGTFDQLLVTPFRLGPTLDLPIFDRGRWTTVHLYDVRAQQAALAYQRTVLGALHEVENALAAYAADQQRRIWLDATVAQNRDALSLSRLRYESGVAAFIDVLDVRRTLQENELSLADSTTSVATDIVRLYRALGGGWQQDSARAPCCR